MVEIFSIIGVFTCVGLLVYYRYTDIRNVSMQNLKDYLTQSEKHIEIMLRKKEKEFADKMIVSEIIIERMHRLTSVLQEKLDSFDQEIVQGQELYNALKQELVLVGEDLFEYKTIRAEFKDIEDRVEAILNIKQQAEDGTAELKILREKMIGFTKDYQHMTDDIKTQSRQELDGFFHTMQNDLSDYLIKARQQLSDKDIEMTNQIQELGAASGSMADSIREFKDYAQNSIEQLKQDSEKDLEIVKKITESNITDIYDMWERVKEDTQQKSDGIQNNLYLQKDFFENAESNLRNEIEHFNKNLSTISVEIQTNLEFNAQEKAHELDMKITDIYTDIEHRGMEVKTQLEEALTSQTISVREELERLYSAFVEQEQAIEEKIRVLGSRVSENLGLAEKNYNENLSELNNTIIDTKKYAEDTLQIVTLKIEDNIKAIEENFQEKANTNMLRIEDNFKESNHERMEHSINEITKSLEEEIKKRYKENIEKLSTKAEELEEVVQSKFLYVKNLDSKFLEINEMFNNEKEKIMLMCTELEKDRENSTEIILQQVTAYMNELQNELTVSVKDFLDDGVKNFGVEQELWKDRFDEVVTESRDEFQRMKNDIDSIHRFISNIEDTSLAGLKREAERIAQEAEYRIDDLKKYVSDLLRSGKEDFLIQTDQAKQEIKDLKQDLWNQEKEIKQIAQKDLDRLNVKIKDVDKLFQNFVKKSDRLSNVEELLRKLDQQYNEINNMKKELGQMTTTLKESHDLGHNTIDQIQSFKKDLENKAHKLAESSSEADRIQEFLLSAIQEANGVTQLFASLTEEREKAQSLEELLLKNLEVFNELQDSLNQLENKKQFVDNMINAIESSEDSVSNIMTSSEDMHSRMHEINEFTQEIQTKLSGLQKEMNLLAGDQTKVKTAVSKLQDLDHMMIHIEEEMKRLEKMREWIAISMTNVDRMGAKQGLSPFSSTEESGLDDVNVKNVLRLYEKDWSIGDIAKNLKVSSAYVELIIERYRS